jgi:PAS domain S-box-containing protein
MYSQATSQIKARKISKAVFQTMVEKASDGIFVYQGQRFFYVNPAFEKMLGYDQNELEYMSLKDVVNPQTAGVIEERYNRQIHGENGSDRYDVVFITRKKQERIITISSSVIILSGEAATLNIARDTTERKIMLEHLESSNQFLTGLIENSSDAIIATDFNGNPLIFNKAAEEITGYTAEEMISRKISMDEFMGKGERKRIISILNRGSAEKPYRLVAEETSLYIKDGTLIPISLSASYVYQGGEPIAGISIFRDLRPIKQVQEKLKASEQKYRILVENANDGIFVYQDHRFKYTNPKFRELLGYTQEELGDMGFRDIVRPELGDLIEGRYAKRIRGERVPERYEIALLGKDGIWRAFEINPSIIEYEEKVATQNIIRDITQKREARKALRASEAKYRATVEHTGTAIMLLEDNRIISLVNKQMERLSGYKREEIEGKMPFTRIVHPEDRKRMAGYHKARREGRKDVPSEYEFRFIDKEGNVKDSFITIGMIPGTRQSIVSIMDITDIKRMELELEKSRKMALLGEMSAHVAHEVRNPLQKIKTGVELLLHSKSLDGRQKKLFEGVTNGVDNLEKFVTQILEWTRSGKIRPKPFSISNIIEGLIFNRDEQFSRQGIEVNTAFDTENDTIIVDGIQLRQLIENLIDNAIDAMPDGGMLNISTLCVPGYTFVVNEESVTCDALEICVEDTGSGIQEQDLQSVFQPFFTKKSQGTGLGLALVQKIVDMHHGEIDVFNPNSGGTKFAIRLPIDLKALKNKKSLDA